MVTPKQAGTPQFPKQDLQLPPTLGKPEEVRYQAPLARTHSGTTHKGPSHPHAVATLQEGMPRPRQDEAKDAPRPRPSGPRSGPRAARAHRASPTPWPDATGAPVPPPRCLHRIAASSRWHDGPPLRPPRETREALGPAAPFTDVDQLSR
jgi:hypothetical protein